MTEGERVRSARMLLDDWRFWIGVAYFGLVAVLVLLYVLFTRTADEEAARVAQQRASAVTQVEQCYQRIDSGDQTASVLEEMSRAFAAMAVNTDDRIERTVTLRAVNSIDALRDTVLLGAPSKSECRTLAAKLGVATEPIEGRTNG